MVVLTTLFSIFIKDSLIHPKVFSTTDAIVQWLNNKKIDNQLISSVINQLKEQSNILDL